MIEFHLERDRKRVVFSLRGAGGPGVRRNTGELAYNLQTESGWCDPITMEDVASGARVLFRGRSRNRDVQVAIRDRIVCDSNAIVVERTWSVSDPGEYRFFIDYRLLTASSGVLVPSYLYAPEDHHVLRTPVTFYEDRLTLPAILFPGSEVCHSVLLVERSFNVPGEWECATDDRQPALQVRLPPASSQSGATIRVSRNEAPAEFKAHFAIEVSNRVEGLLVHSYEAGWHAGWNSPAAAGDRRGSYHRDCLSLIEYAEAKRGFVAEHTVAWRGSQSGSGPALDNRGGRSARLFTATEPYGGLVAALALADDPAHDDERLRTAMEIAMFFTGGLQPDGTFRDVFDPVSRKWGSVTSGTTEFHPGPGSETRALESAILFARVYESLRTRGVEQQRLIRVAAEIAHRAMRAQDSDGSYLADGSGGAGSPEDTLLTCLAVSLLVVLERVRGRHSTRVSSLKRAAGHLAEVVTRRDWMLHYGSSRSNSLAVFRAALDLVDSQLMSVDHPFVEGSGATLLSWIMARDIDFPRRSPASRRGVSARGMGVVSVDRPHLEFDVLPVALELFRWFVDTGNNTVGDVARQVCSAATQLLAPPGKPGVSGGQPAEVDFVNWSSHGGPRSAPGKISGARTIQAATAAVAAMDIGRLMRDSG